VVDKILQYAFSSSDASPQSSPSKMDAQQQQQPQLTPYATYLNFSLLESHEADMLVTAR
jgi:hypothetical protein